jgi:uroporphyrinogen-III decarboxylase
MNLWMGPEGLIFAAHDCPELLRALVRDINAANLRLVDLLAQSPAEVILVGDNFSTDLQPPSFFNQWSRDYYVEAIRRLQAAGKYVAFHIDGRLRGGLELLAGIGVDAADAVTPAPMGDLTADACRDEAGPEMVLSGGVAPNLWLPDVPRERFIAAVRAWLELRRVGPRLIANAGDQVPPGAAEDRIGLMGELVREHGRY